MSKFYSISSVYFKLNYLNFTANLFHPLHTSLASYFNMDDGVEEVAAVPELDNLRPSPEQRTNVVLRLLEEVVTIGVEENNHDLQLFFLDFAPPVLADLHRHIPALATMEKTLAHASLVLGLAASTGPTRSAQQQQRVEDAIRAKGPDFLRALGRYRIDPTPLVEPNDQFLALLNYFQYGRQILQHAILHSAALRQMVDRYVELFPKINQISDFSNRLIMSDVTKNQGYDFAKDCQADLKSLAEACRKFYQLVIPVFRGRSFEEVRSVFINLPLEHVPEDFERLAELSEANSLHSVALPPVSYTHLTLPTS